MTIENGGDQPANDTVLTNDDAAQNQPAPADDNPETDPPEDGDDQDKDPDEVEIDLGDTKVRISRKVKEAIAKPFQQDYTAKTEDLAKQRKALDGEREGFKGQTAAQQAHFDAALKVRGLDDQLKQYDDVIARYDAINWNELSPEQQAEAQRLRYQRGIFKEQRDTAARDFSTKEQEHRQNAARENDTRIQTAMAEITRHLPEWTPGNDLDQKLLKYGSGLGLPEKGMGEAVILVPQLAKELNRLRLYDEAAAKLKIKQTFDQSQAAQPVTRVGGNGGSAARRTTDASGDALSTEEWAKRERERMRKQG